MLTKRVVLSILLVILIYIGHNLFLSHAQDMNDEVAFFIENANDYELLSRFIKNYPDSAHLRIAQERLDALTAISAFPVPRLTKTFRVTPETLHQ